MIEAQCTFDLPLSGSSGQSPLSLEGSPIRSISLKSNSGSGTEISYTTASGKVYGEKEAGPIYGQVLALLGRQ